MTNLTKYGIILTWLGKEVTHMSLQERTDIVDTLNSLPNDQLQFILGYAAGLGAAQGQKSDPPEEKAS